MQNIHMRGEDIFKKKKETKKISLLSFLLNTQNLSILSNAGLIKIFNALNHLTKSIQPLFWIFFYTITTLFLDSASNMKQPN